MKKFLPLLLFAISSSFFTKTYAQVNVGDSLALVDLYNSTNGKILLTKTIDGNGEINISALAAGLYYLRNAMTGEERKIIIK